jgi:hypothetical protein
MYRPSHNEVDNDYTDFVYSQILELASDKISTFTLKEYINSANDYSELVKFVRENDLNSLNSLKMSKIAKKINEGAYNLIIVEEYDNGDKSPFVLKRFNTYVINSHEGKLNHIGEGVCHYSPEVNFVTFIVPVLFLFILSFLIPVVSRFLGLISIPENCLDAMTYMIAPLAFIIGLVMPFITNIILGIVGFALPPGNADLLQHLPMIIILVAVFRIAPMIGMVAFCIRSNLYTEYLREKWFLLIVTIGGTLGNMCWLILGMLMEMSYTGTMM